MKTPYIVQLCTAAMVMMSDAVFATGNASTIETREVEMLNTTVSTPTGILCHKDTVSVIEGKQRSTIITEFDFEGRPVSQHPLPINNTDWQALAQDDEFIYVADIGNATGLRKTFSIYRMDKGFLGLVDDIQITYESHQAEKTQTQASDAAAIALDNDTLYLFSKNKVGEHGRIYRLNVVEDEQALNPLHTLPHLPGPITGAAFDINIDKFYLVGSTATSMSKNQSQGFLAVLNLTFSVEEVHILPAFSGFTGACVHENGLWLVQPRTEVSAPKLVNVSFE